jgi:hypothetical protein
MVMHCTIILDAFNCRSLEVGGDLLELKDELQDIQSEYEALLTDSTTFPRAGNTNQPYAINVISYMTEFWIL